MKGLRVQEFKGSRVKKNTKRRSLLSKAKSRFCGVSALFCFREEYENNHEIFRDKVERLLRPLKGLAMTVKSRWAREPRPYRQMLQR